MNILNNLGNPCLATMVFIKSNKPVTKIDPSTVIVLSDVSPEDVPPLCPKFSSHARELTLDAEEARSVQFPPLIFSDLQ